MKGGERVMELKSYGTHELVEELKKREGVETHQAEPYTDLDFTVNGPALIIIVTD